VFAGPAHVCLVSCFCFGIGKVFSANLSSKADPSFAFTQVHLNSYVLPVF